MTRPSLGRAARYTVDPVGQARAALRRGPIIPAGAHYSFRGRRFNRATVNVLIEAGEAHRLEDGQVIGRAALPMVLP